MGVKAVPERAKATEEIYKYLREHGCGTAREISEHSGLGMDLIVSTLMKLNGRTVKSTTSTAGKNRRTVWRFV